MLFVKVPQHKIHSCSTSCAVQLAEPNCCTEIQMQQVFRISCDDGEAPTCCASRTNDYIGDVSSLALVFVPFFQLTVSSARSLAVYSRTCCSKHVNPLKTKRRLLYLKTSFVPPSKHFSSRLQKPDSLCCKWHKSLFVLR